MHKTNSEFETRKYWHNLLSQPVDPSCFPRDYQRPDRFVASEGSIPLVIEEPLYAPLTEVSGDDADNMYALLMAVLKVCLYKHTGSRRIVVGSPARRTHPAGDDPQHVLPIVDIVDGATTFRKLLGWIKQTLRDAYRWQDFDPANVLADLGQEEIGNRCPLFDVAIRLADIHGPMGACRNDMSIDLQRTGDGLRGEVRFRTALWKEATVSTFGERYWVVLESALSNIDLPIADITCLTGKERQRLLFEWNRTEFPLAAQSSIHGLFVAQAVRFPDAPAVQLLVDNETTTVLSFGELDRQSNQLAQYLRNLGVGPEVIVGVCLRRGAGLMVTLLAILKARGAYLPVDPDAPRERNTTILAQARVSVIVSQAELKECLSQDSAALVLVDDDWSKIARLSAQEPESGVNADNLSNVIFTSGSTGQPKGVMVTHRGMVNYLNWCLRTYKLEKNKPVPVHGSLAADMTVTSLWAPLLAGCPLLMLPEGSGTDPLTRALASDLPFSLLKVTPSHLAALSHGFSTEDSRGSISCLVVGGEALRADMISLWQTYEAPSAIYNEYGPTETVVGSTAYCIPEHGGDVGMFPIGRPIDNTQVYILDTEMQPVPIGVTGELYIGGSGVSRGYLNQPGLTAERFVPDPHSRTGGTRLYRTGDLGRFRPDGNIEFLGRWDDQIKIRGHRVEPGEVEAALAAHEAVKEAVVIARQDRGITKLAGYFVPRGQVPSLSELHRFLRRRLPAPMIPNSLVVIEQVPRLPSGKVDRRALPSPDDAQLESQAPKIAPVSEDEATLAAIWSEVLNHEDVGIQDNFFELGGDSILSVHVIARARDAGLHLQLGDIFEHPTIAELARYVKREAAVRTETTQPNTDLALLPIQLRWIDLGLSKPEHFNQSFMLRIANEVDVELIERALNLVVMHHEPLRVCFRHESAEWHQRLMDARPSVSIVALDLSSLNEAAQLLVMEAQASVWQATMDLSRGSLVRAIHFYLGGDRGSRLLLAIHHFVVDVVSWLILLDDLSHAYDRITAGKIPRLAPATTPPWRWGDLLRRQVESGAFDDELEYWLAHTRRSASVLPSDSVSADINPLKPGAIETALDLEDADRLLREVPAAYPVRIEELLVAAMYLAIRRWSGCERLLIDIERHGREAFSPDVDLSRTVGWLTSLHPLFVDPSPDASPIEVLEVVKDCMRAVPRNGLGYTALRYLGNEPVRRALNAMPQAQCAFNFLGRMDSGGAKDGFFELSDDPRGVEQSRDNGLSHDLLVDVFVAGGRLWTRWSYRLGTFQRDTVAALIESFAARLYELIRHCLSGERARYRPSDFDLADLDQETLDRIVTRIEGK